MSQQHSEHEKSTAPWQKLRRFTDALIGAPTHSFVYNNWAAVFAAEAASANNVAFHNNTEEFNDNTSTAISNVQNYSALLRATAARQWKTNPFYLLLSKRKERSFQVCNSHSYESLLHLKRQQQTNCCTKSTTNFAPSSPMNARPMHPSLLANHRHSELLSTTLDSMGRVIPCQTKSNTYPWPQSSRSSLIPDLKNKRHKKNSLKLWILEAKSLPSKKKYFCELYIDGTIYARTTTKQKLGADLFWGEVFNLNNLPDVNVVTVKLYREYKKKSKKDRNNLLGSVHIDAKNINNRAGVERWYTASLLNDINYGVVPISTSSINIRIKACYQSIEILPLHCYAELQKFLTVDYMCILRSLESTLSVRAKEDLAFPLISIFQYLGRAPELLSNLVQEEVDQLENSVIFRGNSLATKSMECYLKLVGAKYLHQTLACFIRDLLHQPHSCEADPSKVENNYALSRNQKVLRNFSEALWTQILKSFAYFPRDLRDVFTTIRHCMTVNGHADCVDHLISASIFLRFLCPAVMAPSLFGLSQEYPDERSVRNCTLIAKVIQSLANTSPFEGKEGYMNFMNPFIDQHMNEMRSFLRKISNMAAAEDCENALHFDGNIDLGYELALIHNLLTEYMRDFFKTEDLVKEPKLLNLKNILTRLANMLNQEENVHLEETWSSNYTDSSEQSLQQQRNETLLENEIEEEWSRLLQAASKENVSMDVVEGVIPPELRLLLAELQSPNISVGPSETKSASSTRYRTYEPLLQPTMLHAVVENTSAVRNFQPACSSMSLTPINTLSHRSYSSTNSILEMNDLKLSVPKIKHVHHNQTSSSVARFSSQPVSQKNLTMPQSSGPTSHSSRSMERPHYSESPFYIAAKNQESSTLQPFNEKRHSLNSQSVRMGILSVQRMIQEKENSVANRCRTPLDV